MDPVGPVLTFLLENTKEYIKYNVDLIGGVNENIRQLLTDMDEMRAFVKQYGSGDDAYLEKITDEVQNVVFQAEDTIEQYIVYKQQDKFQSRFGKLNPFSKIDHLGNLKTVGIECQQVSAKMRDLTRNKLPIVMNETRNVAAGNLPKTERTQPPLQNKIIGFEDVAKDVKNLLVGESLDLEVHSIVGMVGLGKTTLAKKVFDDTKIEYRFFARAFVVVSEKYDKKEVYLNILSRFVDISEKKKMLVDTIRDEIYEYLKGKQYLIVLDDVWKEKDWDDLKSAFPQNQKKSRVLITTRETDVARHANPSVEPYRLRFMNPTESKDLLRFNVFGNIGCPSYLEPQILKYEDPILTKCKGLPLAIVVIAGILLHEKYIVEAWRQVHRRVMDSEHTIEKMSSDLIKYSFDNLPYYMKSCFLYFGVFPEDTDIPVWKLLRLWIAEGFIQGKGDPEAVAERYLRVLVDKNLVMVAERKLNGRIKKCRIHDFLREFCKTEALNRSLFSGNNAGSAIETGKLGDDYRRISINDEILGYVQSQPTSKHLRSFLSFPKEEEVLLPEKYFPVLPGSFSLLRVFDARKVIFKSFPPEMFYLFLLKYVAMTCNIGILGQKLSQLLNLQTFIFETNCNTVNVKADIWKLQQLRHLHINTSATLPPITAASIPTKSKLQTLSTIAPESCTRQVFEKCKDVKKLGIRGKLARFVDPLFENLSILGSLESLKLINSDSRAPLPNLPAVKQFPCNLIKLTLCGTSIRWELMSTLGNLENLTVLKLKDNAFVGHTWIVKEKGFPCLTALHIEKTDLVEWKASSFDFPALTTLILKNCKELKAIPHDFGMIDSLQKIDLHWSNNVLLSAKYIENLKLQTPPEKNFPKFKLGVYPPDSVTES